MAFCPSGVSGPKAGAQDLVAYNGTVLAGFIEAFLGPEAIPLAALVGVLSFDTGPFCSADPPTFPTLTAADVASLVTQSITGVDVDPAATARFIDLLKYFAWFQLCECKTAATPPANSFTWPGGSVINPTGLAPSSNPCGQATYGLNFNNFDFQANPSGVSLRDINNLGIKMFPNMPTKTVTSSAYSASVTAIDIGATPPTSVTLKWGPITSADSNSASSSVTIKYYTSALAEIAGSTSINFSGNNIAGATPPVTAGVPSTARYCTILSDTADAFKNRTAEVDIAFVCPGSTTFNSPCCPPDPVAQQLLQRILTLTTLIQRQVAPFAYVTGTTHSGLSGTGEISIQGLLGIKVTPSSIPGPAGRVTGDPDSLWLDSWVRWGNADGWGPREFLTASPYLSLPSLAGQYTKIGYTLNLGLTVDIQELVREA